MSTEEGRWRVSQQITAGGSTGGLGECGFPMKGVPSPRLSFCNSFQRSLKHRHRIVGTVLDLYEIGATHAFSHTQPHPRISTFVKEAHAKGLLHTRLQSSGDSSCQVGCFAFLALTHATILS